MIQSVEAYITKEIESLVNTSFPGTNGVDSADKLMSIILSKRYRKSKVSQEQKDSLYGYISSCITEKKPIDIYLMTGGYKQPRLPSAPHIDWAEIFNIMYMFKFGRELASHYNGEINITYRTHGSIVSILNDISEEDTQLYRDEFQKILDYFSNLMRVPNLSVKTEEAYTHAEAKVKLDELGEDFFDTIDPNDIVKAKRNFVNKEISDDVASKSFALNKQFLKTDSFISQPFHSDKICIFFRGVGPSDRLSYGSTKSSDVQYWSGVGVISSSSKGKPYMDIVGHSKLGSNGYMEVKSSLFNEYPGLDKIKVAEDILTKDNL